MPSDFLIGGAAGGGIAGVLNTLYQRFTVDKRLDHAHEKIDEMNKRFDVLERDVLFRLQSIKDAQAQDSLYAARSFVTKNDLDRSVAPIDEKLEKLYEKIENIHSSISRHDAIIHEKGNEKYD